MGRRIAHGLGWVPDVPDYRDYAFTDQPIYKRLSRLRNAQPAQDVDLREFFVTEADDQRNRPMSPVFACLGLVEYFHARAAGQTLDASPEFLYCMVKKLSRLTGNSGVGIRNTLKAIRRFGLPPELLWSTMDPSDEAPRDPSLFAFAREYKSIRYFRLDFATYAASSGKGKRKRVKAKYFEAVLRNVKSFLEAGFPVVFGFSVPSSVFSRGKIEYRRSESLLGGQAVLAVGYDEDNLIFRNSWGHDWGDAGYGRLPYRFLLNGYASDCWSALKPDWLTDDFRRPSVLSTAD